MASDYELNRVCAEEYLNYYDKHRGEIDFSSLVIESISLHSVDIRSKIEVKEIKALGVLMGITPENPNYIINALVIGNAEYETAGGNRFTLETKWGFTNNKQLFSDDFAELMFKDLEHYLETHFSSPREMEE